MSMINQTPFLNATLKKLDETDIKKLDQLVNGSYQEPEFVSLLWDSPNKLTSSYYGISFMKVEVKRGLNLIGYLLYRATFCVLIYFSNDSQSNIAMVDIDSSLNPTFINEKCTVTELRSEIADLMAAQGLNIKVQADDVETPNIAAGKVLMADGDGGAGWQTIDTKTYKPFPTAWPTTGTTAAFCAAVNADATADVARAYLGEVTFSDLPASMANAEITVEVMSGTGTSNKVILLTCTSGNRAPYLWNFTYWDNGTNVSGWVSPVDKVASDIGAPAYDSTLTYDVGDIVSHGNKIYQCTTAIATPEEWTAAHWMEGTIAEIVLGMINAEY